MTVIVYKDGVLAADKQGYLGEMKIIKTKIWRVDHKLIGGAGSSDVIAEVVAWIKAGCNPEKYPKMQRESNECSPVLVVQPDGTAQIYERTPYPVVYDKDQPVCLGSGREFARMALHLGKTPVEAVRLTSELCASCGGGVDWLSITLEDDKCEHVWTRIENPGKSNKNPFSQPMVICDLCGEERTQQTVLKI